MPKMKEMFESGMDAQANDLPEKILSTDEFHDVSRPAPGVNSARERQPATYDSLYVSPRLYKELGVDPTTHKIEWTNRDNWMNLGYDHPGEYIDRNPGSFMPTFKGGEKEGKPLYRKDLVAMARPLEQIKAVEARLNENAKLKKEQDEHGIENLTEQEMEERREANQAYLNQLLHGSPTQGKSLEEAGRIFSEEQTREMRNRYMPPRVRSYNARAIEDNVKDVAAETSKAVAKGRGGTYSVNVAFDKQTGKRIA